MCGWGYVCTYMCMCVHVCVCMCVCVCMYVCMYVCLCVRMMMRVCVYTCNSEAFKVCSGLVKPSHSGDWCFAARQLAKIMAVRWRCVHCLVKTYK